MAKTHSCCSGGGGLRFFAILAVGAVAAVAVTIFSARVVRTDISATPPPEPMARMSAKRLQAHASDNGIVGGATMAQNSLAVRETRDGITISTDKGVRIDSDKGVRITTGVNTNPNVTMQVSMKNTTQDAAQPAIKLPESSKPENARVAIKFSVRSEAPHVNRDKAINDALEVADKQLREHLRNLDSPIERAPSQETIRTQFVQSNQTVLRKVEDPALIEEWKRMGLESDRSYAHLEIEVTDEQLRSMRGEQRLESGIAVAVLALIAVVALFGFLKLDGWTKGYLTTILALGSTAAVGTAVVLYFIAW